MIQQFTWIWEHMIHAIANRKIVQQNMQESTGDMIFILHYHDYTINRIKK